jgi:hypothetical protein
MEQNKSDIEWRLELITNPPKSSKIYSPEEWRHIVLYELTREPTHYDQSGEKSYWYGKHRSEDTKRKIKENNSCFWLGKTDENHPATGQLRPDSVEIARRMGLNNKGKPVWNSGKTGLQCHSQETRKKMSEAHIGRKKPSVTCPHCKKIGGEGAMIRWHFDNCKEKK